MQTTISRRVQSAVQAVAPSVESEFFDCDATLLFNYVLQPNQTVNNLQQPIDSNGDFWLCGIQASGAEFQRVDLTSQASTFSLCVSDDVGYKLMSDYLPIGFFTPAYGNPWPYVVRRSHMFKAGTRITIDLQETSGFTTIVQIAFRGRYRYRLSDVQTAQRNLLANKRGR
jgi:hypothetical protein